MSGNWRTVYLDDIIFWVNATAKLNYGTVDGNAAFINDFFTFAAAAIASGGENFLKRRPSLSSK